MHCCFPLRPSVCRAYRLPNITDRDRVTQRHTHKRRRRDLNVRRRHLHTLTGTEWRRQCQPSSSSAQQPVHTIVYIVCRPRAHAHCTTAVISHCRHLVRRWNPWRLRFLSRSRAAPASALRLWRPPAAACSVTRTTITWSSRSTVRCGMIRSRRMTWIDRTTAAAARKSCRDAVITRPKWYRWIWRLGHPCRAPAGSVKVPSPVMQGAGPVTSLTCGSGSAIRCGRRRQPFADGDTITSWRVTRCYPQGTRRCVPA